MLDSCLALLDKYELLANTVRNIVDSITEEVSHRPAGDDDALSGKQGNVFNWFKNVLNIVF